MILNFKINKLIIFILVGLICLGILWLISNNKIKEGAGNNPQSSTADAKLINSKIMGIIEESNLPFDKLNNLSENDLNLALNGLTELETSINEGTLNKMDLSKGAAGGAFVSGPAVDTTEPTCNKTFFTGAEAEDGFCNVKDSPQERNIKCSALTLENCNMTDCCIVLNGSKCVAGDATGPIFKTENGEDVDYSFYAYKSECYGSCGKGVGKAANPCSAFQDDDTNVSKACLQRLWANTECPNTTFIDDAQVAQYKDYTKKSLKTKFKYAKNEDNYAQCYGVNESSWPAPCDNTNDTSFGLSKRCIMKLFNDTSCPYKETVNDVFVEKRSIEPKSAIINEFTNMKNDKNEAAYLKCYGPDKSKWPDPCAGVADDANLFLGTLPIQCTKKIYLDNMKDVGCTSADVVDTWYTYIKVGTTQKQEQFAGENAGKAPKDILYSKAWFDAFLKDPNFKNSMKNNKINCYGLNPNKWDGVTPVIPDPCSTLKYETLVDAVDPACLRRLADALPSEKCSNENKAGATASYFVDGNLQWGDAYKKTLRNAFDEGKNDYLINPIRRDMKLGDVFSRISNFYTRQCTL